MQENHCINTINMGQLLPHTDIHLPPCSIGRLACRLMECALYNGGHTKEMGYNAIGGGFLEISFSKFENQTKFTQEANALINGWPATDNYAISDDPNWKTNMATYLQLYRELQEKIQPLLHYLDGVEEKDAIDAMDKACELSPQLEEAIRVFARLMQAYQVSEHPIETDTKTE